MAACGGPRRRPAAPVESPHTTPVCDLPPGLPDRRLDLASARPTLMKQALADQKGGAAPRRHESVTGGWDDRWVRRTSTTHGEQLGFEGMPERLFSCTP